MRAIISILLVFLVACSVVSPEPDSANQGIAVERIASYEAQKLISDGATVLDVRSDSEFEGGHLPNAKHIIHSEIAQNLDKLGSDKNKPIVVYCRSGRRAGIAADELVKNGYTKVFNAGGYDKLAERMGSSS